MGRVCMGRVCYGPSLSWAEFVMSRVVQLPNKVHRIQRFFCHVRETRKMSCNDVNVKCHFRYILLLCNKTVLVD